MTEEPIPTLGEKMSVLQTFQASGSGRTVTMRRAESGNVMSGGGSDVMTECDSHSGRGLAR